VRQKKEGKSVRDKMDRYIPSLIPECSLSILAPMPLSRFFPCQQSESRLDFRTIMADDIDDCRERYCELLQIRRGCPLMSLIDESSKDPRANWRVKFK